MSLVTRRAFLEGLVVTAGVCALGVSSPGQQPEGLVSEDGEENGTLIEKRYSSISEWERDLDVGGEGDWFLDEG